MGKIKVSQLQSIGSGSIVSSDIVHILAKDGGSFYQGRTAAISELVGWIQTHSALTAPSASFSISSSYADSALSASYAPVSLPPGILSGSAQIASSISGAFAEASGGFSTRITELEDFSSSLLTVFATTAEIGAATQSLSSSLATKDADLQSQINDIEDGTTTVGSSSYAETASYYNPNIPTYEVLIGGASSPIASSYKFTYNPLSGLLLVTGSSTMTGDLTVGGTITAQEFHTEFISSSIIYESGSTKFGDSSDDTHEFTGSILHNGTGSFSGLRTGKLYSISDDSNQIHLDDSKIDCRINNFRYWLSFDDVFTVNPDNNITGTRLNGVTIMSGSVDITGSLHVSDNIKSRGKDVITEPSFVNVSTSVTMSDASHRNNIVELSGSNEIHLEDTLVSNGFQVVLTNLSAATQSFTTGSGVTLRSKNGHNKFYNQYGAVTAYYSSSNWTVFGDLGE